MNGISIAASNGIILSADDLKKAVETADVNWTLAAYASQHSKDPIDICTNDFFDTDHWKSVDDLFVQKYEMFEDIPNALASVIESRAESWSEKADREKAIEEKSYTEYDRPFSLEYAQLYIECNHEEDFFSECGIDAVYSKVSFVDNYTGCEFDGEYSKYNYSFIWGDVSYEVSLLYKGDILYSGEWRDGQPDCITIDVKATNE